MKLKKPGWYLLVMMLGGVIIILTGCSLPQRLQPTPTLNLTEVYTTLAAMVTTQPALTPTPDQSGSTASPAPSHTPAQSSPTPPLAQASGTILPTQAGPCNLAAPGSPIDFTIPDNTLMEPGGAFTKIWRLVNVGTCTWTVDYRAAFFYGDRMDAPSTVPLGQPVPPGAMVEIAVEMIAPLMPGTYQGNWKLSDAGGILFGIGPNGDAPFWVRILVSEALETTPTPTLTPSPVNTPTPSPTATPPVLSSGSVTLLPANQINLDTLELLALGADLEYQAGASTYHLLVPMEDVLLGVAGSLEPGLEDCQNASMSSAPIAVESLALGTYMCYRTDQGAAGRARLATLDLINYALTLDVLTWALP